MKKLILTAVAATVMVLGVGAAQPTEASVQSDFINNMKACNGLTGTAKTLCIHHAYCDAIHFIDANC